MPPEIMCNFHTYEMYAKIDLFAERAFDTK